MSWYLKTLTPRGGGQLLIVAQRLEGEPMRLWVIATVKTSATISRPSIV